MFVSLRTAGIRRGTHLASTTGHNHRTAPDADGRIDQKRTHQNQHLIKTAESIPEAVQKRVEDSGVKIPRDASVVAQELVLSASPEYFRPAYHRDDPDGWGKYDKKKMEKWKDTTMDWLKEKFGEKNLVDVVLHLDERTPHIHAIVLPITEVELKHRRTKEQKKADTPNTTYTKTKWNRTKVFGLEQHHKMQDEYAKALKPLGLNRGIPKKFSKKQHTEIKEYHKENWKAMNDEMVAPNFDPNIDTSIEGFKLPKPKSFESAKKYVERLEDNLMDFLSEEVNDNYVEKVKQFEEAVEGIKDFIEILGVQAKQQKEKNEALTRTLKNMTNSFEEIGREIENPEIVEKLIQDIMKKSDPEEAISTDFETPSDSIKTRRNTTKKPSISPSQ